MYVCVCVRHHTTPFGGLQRPQKGTTNTKNDIIKKNKKKKKSIEFYLVAFTFCVSSWPRVAGMGTRQGHTHTHLATRGATSSEDPAQSIPAALADHIAQYRGTALADALSYEIAQYIPFALANDIAQYQSLGLELMVAQYAAALVAVRKS